jgi:hypothetical protein
MQEHVFNLYPIENQNELSISYRLAQVDGELGLGSDDPDLAAKNLNLLAKRVAMGQKLPVAIIRGGEKPMLAVAANRAISDCDYQLTPHVATLRLQNEVFISRLGSLDSASTGIALSFLAWELRSHLYEHRDLWQSGPNTFFRKKPVNSDETRRRLDIYGGFSPRFLFVDGLLHVAIPVIYCYTDARWADGAFDDHTIRRLGGRKMLYHFGSRVYPIKFQRRTGKSILEQVFCPEGSNEFANVFDWTVKSAGRSPGGRLLEPGSPAIQYRNPGNDKERYGALSLCKLMLHNEDPGVATCRREHQRTPEQRIDSATAIAKHFLSGLSLSGIPLRIRAIPRTRKGKQFDYPAMRFGNGRILRVSNNPGDGGVALQDLPKIRASLLEDGRVGFAVLSEFDDQVLVAPRSLGPAIVNDLKTRVEGMVAGLTRKPYTLQLARYSNENKRTLREQVDTVVAALDENSINGARGILVLPPKSKPDLHNYIKKKLRNRVQFQCMSAEKLGGFYRMDERSNGNGGHGQVVRPMPEGRFRSYLLNTVMGLMIVNRQWAWVLNGGTHYDAYIALDVLDHTAAFTFFYEGGAVCAMRDQDSSHKEKLSRGLVGKLVYEGLKQDLPDLDKAPRSVVLRRDGRLFESEWLGFEDAIKKLVDEGGLPREIAIGAVEIPKHHSFGVRLVERTQHGLENPRLGSWEKLSESEGIVCTTGWPFNIPGTAEPLVVRVVRGKLDVQHVLEDTFGSSQLCWPTPAGCMRLPIDLKLCDEHLRAFAAQADEDSALFDETVENEEEEPLLNAAK